MSAAGSPDANGPVALLLRIIGAVDCLALAAVLMPRSLMHDIAVAVGLPGFPPGPLALYLARSTSLLYALHGVLVLYVSSDVERYLGLIRLLGVLAIVHGSILLAVDVLVGMPPWWCAVEGPTFAATGWLLLWLLNRGSGLAAQRRSRS